MKNKPLGSKRNPIRMGAAEFARQVAASPGAKVETKNSVTTITLGKTIALTVSPTASPALTAESVGPSSVSSEASTQPSECESPPDSDDPHLPSGIEPDRLRPSSSTTEPGRLWAVFALAHTVEVAESIVAGRPVMARWLDVEALRRALRGRPLPNPLTYITVGPDELDAINEAGPFRLKRRRR